MFPPSAFEGSTDTVRGGFDDSTRRYIERAQIVFDDLRELASQLAALMVLAAAADRTANVDHPMFVVAVQRWSDSQEAVRALRPSALAAHHHLHLSKAARLFGAAIDAMRVAGTLVGRSESALGTLKSAWQEMVHTSNALPGFHSVDLQQACCACHGPARIRLAGN
jgi:hypothetical protein